ncbi:MAG: RluA family pseudouridine synthase [Microthrixaceae bacterium]
MNSRPGDAAFVDETIPSALSGERVDRLVALLTDCTRAEAASSVTDGSVHLDGRVVTKPSTRAAEGARLVVDRDPRRTPDMPHADESVVFEVVYEDDDVVVIDKPAGLVVHPAPGHAGETLVNGAVARWPDMAGVGEVHRPGIVHRLDKGTSGLMVLARSERAYLDLVDQLATHDVTRDYEALVWGRVATAVGSIDAPVGRSRRNPLRMAVTSDGRYARTNFAVRAHLDGDRVLTRLDVSLETGRTHQIRVHLRSIGHPVVGDDLYGGRRPPLGLARPFLHARRLRFDHPGSGEAVEFEAPLPDDLRSCLEALGATP